MINVTWDWTRVHPMLVGTSITFLSGAKQGFVLANIPECGISMPPQEELQLLVEAIERFTAAVTHRLGNPPPAVAGPASELP